MGDDIQSLSLLAGVAIDQGPENAIIPLSAPVEQVSHVDVIDGPPVSTIVKVMSSTDDSGGYYIPKSRTSHEILDQKTTCSKSMYLGDGANDIQEDGTVGELNKVSVPMPIREEHSHGIIKHGKDYPFLQSQATEPENFRSCFLCNEKHDLNTLVDIFDDENQQCSLLELLHRYILSSPIKESTMKQEFLICQLCMDMIFNWHSYYCKIKGVLTNNLSVTDKGDGKLTRKINLETYFKPKGSRKYRHTVLKSRIKRELFSSSYHHLVKRNLSEEDFEYIAERLYSTKSNSSTKVKEIEALVKDSDKIVSIFCSECEKSIINEGERNNYKQHRLEFHQNSVVTYPCDMCGNYYPEKDVTGLSQNYFPHWLNHFYFHKCSICPARFPNTSFLKHHEETHRKRAEFQCPICDKILAKKVTLEKHIKIHLPEEERKKLSKACNICGKMLSASTLKAHTYSVHSNERPWKCEICGTAFKHKSDLTGHRNTVHLKMKNYHCKICSQSFSHSCGLRTHMAKHENRRQHECSFCQKKFITGWHLKMHLISHKTEKDIICHICGKGFKRDDALQEHITIHTGEKPYECHICGRKVRVLSNLYKHFVIHKKNKTYYSKKEATAMRNAFSNKIILHPPNLETELLTSRNRTSTLPSSPPTVENKLMEENAILHKGRPTNVIYHEPGNSVTALPSITYVPTPVVSTEVEVIDCPSHTDTSVATENKTYKSVVVHANSLQQPSTSTDETWITWTQ